MKIINTPEFKVGALVLVIGLIIGVMSLRVSEDPGFMGNSHHYYFYLEDATGLIKKSPVYIAGIRVGIIRDVTLEHGRAKVEISLEKEAPVRTTSIVEIRSAGILGDKNIVITPGSDVDPLLASGSEIKQVKDSGSLDKVIGQVGKITESLSAAADAIRKAAEGDNGTTLGRTLLNIERLTADLRDLSSDNKGKVNEIIEQVRDITATLDDVINDPSSQGFRAAWSDARQSLQKLDVAVTNIQQITDKVNKGEGTIGRLINDESTIEGINSAITNVNNLVGGVSKIQTSLDFNSWFLSNENAFKSFLGVQIQPGLDRYYLVQVVSDPEGMVDRREIVSSVNGSPQNVTKETWYYKNRIKLTALFAKNYYDFTFKGGMIENTGGFGVDYFLWRRKLKLSADAYDLTNAKARAYARLEFIKGFYLIGGAENLFGGDQKSLNGFIGAGLYLTNDDIKALIGRVNL